MERTFLIRVTRHPLPQEEVLRLALADELPTDYRSRAVTARDFLKIKASNDSTAAKLARETTTLDTAGERLTIEEVCPNGEFRHLEPEQED